jgi:energy-coupling factor transporter ATP-binding protein EcfA2
MKILIIGESGLGKSNISDIIRNGIFKADSNACITVNDPSREVKELGAGDNKYVIDVLHDGENVGDYDIVVNVKTKAFIDRFKELY